MLFIFFGKIRFPSDHLMSTWRASFHISYNTGLPERNTFSFCVSESLYFAFLLEWWLNWVKNSRVAVFSPFYFKYVSVLFAGLYCFSWEICHLFFLPSVCNVSFLPSENLTKFPPYLWFLVFDYNVLWYAWDLLNFLDLCFYHFFQFGKILVIL